MKMIKTHFNLRFILTPILLLAFFSTKSQDLDSQVWEIGEILLQDRDSALKLAIEKIPEVQAADNKFLEAKLRRIQIDALIGIGNIEEALDSITSTRELISIWLPETIGKEKERLRLINANLYYSKANILSDRGMYQEAIKLFQACKRTYQDLTYDPKGLKKKIADANTSMARVYGQMGKIDSAISMNTKSLKVYKELGDTYRISLIHLNLGTNLLAKGDLRGALKNYLQGLEIAERDSSYVRSFFNGAIAQVYDKLRDYDMAIPYARKCLAIAKEDNNLHIQAFVSSDLGAFYMDIGEMDSSIYFQKHSLKLTQNLGQTGNQIKAHRRLAELFIRQKKYRQALSSIKEGLDLLQGENMPEKELRLRITEAECLFELRNLQSSRKAIDRAMELVGNTDLVNNKRDVNERAHKIYTSLGKVSEAYQFLLQYTAYQDSVYKEEKTLEIARIEYDYQLKNETEKLEIEKQQQAQLYEKELEKERLIQNAAFGVSILVIIILILLYRSYQIKQTKNKQLKTKNKEITSLRESEKVLAEEALAFKERELTTITMLSFEKNNLLQRLGDQLSKLTNKVDQRILPDLKEIKKTIKSNLSDETWASFIYHFEQVHPEFFEKLKANYSNLSQNDLKLCAYLKVGLENKVMAQINNITEAGIKKSINRLKKKLNIDGEDSIRDFILNYV